MEAADSVLDSIFGDARDGDDDPTVEDAEMIDAEADEGYVGDAAVAATAAEGRGGEGGGPGHGRGVRGGKKAAQRNKRRKNKRKAAGDCGIMDINRFVIDTCRHLKEKKSYLVWNAVGCLGLAAVNDLVKEVDAIQSCGGQKTADGARSRTGGGILWNILKSREPKAYKEIMSKGREFEKQFWQPKRARKMTKGDDEGNNSIIGSSVSGDEVAELGECKFADQESVPEAPTELGSSSPDKKRAPVSSRIRVPVVYDDLFEEGEIAESS